MPEVWLIAGYFPDDYGVCAACHGRGTEETGLLYWSGSPWPLRFSKPCTACGGRGFREIR